MSSCSISEQYLEWSQWCVCSGRSNIPEESGEILPEGHGGHKRKERQMLALETDQAHSVDSGKLYTCVPLLLLHQPCTLLNLCPGVLQSPDHPHLSLVPQTHLSG